MIMMFNSISWLICFIYLYRRHIQWTSAALQECWAIRLLSFRAVQTFSLNVITNFLLSNFIILHMLYIYCTYIYVSINTLNIKFYEYTWLLTYVYINHIFKHMINVIITHITMLVEKFNSIYLPIIIWIISIYT